MVASLTLNSQNICPHELITLLPSKSTTTFPPDLQYFPINYIDIEPIQWYWRWRWWSRWHFFCRFSSFPSTLHFFSSFFSSPEWFMLLELKNFLLVLRYCSIHLSMYLCIVFHSLNHTLCNAFMHIPFISFHVISLIYIIIIIFCCLAHSYSCALRSVLHSLNSSNESFESVTLFCILKAECCWFFVWKE